MHHVGGVAKMAWIPADLNNPFLMDSDGDRLLGRYVFKVRDLAKLVNNNYANCPTFEVHPDSNWVEKTSYLSILLLYRK